MQKLLNLFEILQKTIWLIKIFFWEMKDKIGRFNYLNAIIMQIPGSFGLELRRIIIPRYFKSCGKDIHILEGVRFRGIHMIEVGDNVRIGIDVFIQGTGGVKLDNDVMLGPGVKIWSVNHKYDDIKIPIPDQGYNYDPVTIGKGVWIGADSFVLPGVNIPEGCVVSAGSIVHKKSYPPYSILIGNPCRVVGTRLKTE
jgi:acetyltransferase-like isoleucine patch superfamily enzyme